MKTTSEEKLRDGLAEMLERVAARGERVVVTRDGREVAALVPVSDLRALEPQFVPEEKQSRAGTVKEAPRKRRVNLAGG